MQKVCCVCGVDVSSQKRVKDARGRYYCHPCVEKVRSGQPAAEPAMAQAAAPAPVEASTEPQSSDELDLLPVKDHAAGDGPKAACSVCRKVLPERQVRNVDGEFVCNACYTQRQQPKRGAATARAGPAATKQEEEDNQQGDGFFHTLTGGLVYSGVALVVGLATFTALYMFLGDNSTGMSIVGAFLRMVFVCFSAGGLMVSMLIAARLLGGISFGYIGPVIFKSIALCTCLAVFDYFASRFETMGFLGLGFRFVVVLVALIVVFRIDGFEAFLLSAVNLILSYLLAFAMLMVLAFALGGPGDEAEDFGDGELDMPVPEQRAPDPAPDPGD
jgi:hypothetical protein